jgi:protein involved in polysaccharide export with SLBB domain
MERRVSLLELITFAGGVRTESGKTVTLVRQTSETQCDNSAVVAAGGEDHVTEVISLKLLLEGGQEQNRLMRPGDIVISHMNRPGRGTSGGYAAALPTLLDRGVRFVRLRDGF